MPGVVLGTGDLGMNKKVPAFKDLPMQWQGDRQINTKAT